MNKSFFYLRLLLLATGGMLLLCIIFAINPELADGAISGKLCWFHFTSLLLAAGTLFMEFTIRKSRFIFSLPDALLLLLFGIVLVTYDKDQNLQPERFLFIAQVIALWFMLRAALQAHQELRTFFLTILIFTGIITAAWGISNSINPEPSTHPIFSLLQISMKPEPFVGYISIIFPICLNTMLRFKNCNMLAWWETRTFMFYFSFVGTIIITIALFSNTDRAAWVAAFISGIWVGWMRMIGWRKTKKTIHQHNRIFTISSIILFIIATSIIMVTNIKRVEAGDRHFLIWNITTKAIMEHPMSGTGIGGFPATFAQTQATYFKTETASLKDKQSAICPQHAYNAYLQIGIELGIIGLLLFTLWLAFSLYYGIKHRQIGASGGILALGVYALYSDPFQLSTYWAILIFLTAICVTNLKQDEQREQRSIPYIGVLAALFSCILFFGQKDYYYSYKEWKTLKELYNDHAYEQAASQYASLSNQLYHRTDFLYEGAQCFYQTGKYEIAILWLDRALKLSAEPKLYYAIAQNKEAISQYQEAEHYLLEISQILPEQGYTYFLLAKLYAKPSFYHPDKLQAVAKKCLSSRSSTQYRVTREMKEDVLHLIEREKTVTP